MKIITYVSSVADDAPEAVRACARILLDGKQGLHPVVFHGPDKHTVRATAQAWWDAEIQRVRDKADNLARRTESMRTARAKPADAQPVEVAA